MKILNVRHNACEFVYNYVLYITIELHIEVVTS